LNPATAKTRATLAAIERHNGPDDPRAPRLRAELTASRLEKQIAAAIDSTPLNPDQRARIVRVLYTGLSGD
jgi:hypothetical protein